MTTSTRKNRRDVPHRQLRLHLGCFDCPQPGWFNTDITPHLFIARLPFAAQVLRAFGQISDERAAQHREGRFRPVHYLNVRKRFPFADASVDCAFSSHVIEHLRPIEARFMLNEIQRVLRPGGICRVVAPSLAHAMARYSEQWPNEFLHAVFQEDQTGGKNRHQWMYTSSSLCQLMTDCGFDAVRPCRFREGRLPDVELIDNRPENSIYVEGEKSAAGAGATGRR